MENTWVKIDVLGEIKDDAPPDSEVKLSFTFIRGTPEPNAEAYLTWIEEVMKGQNVTISYVCDLCSERYSSPYEMNTGKCNHCERYYDYCKTHESITVCPFCNNCVDHELSNL